MDPGTEGIRRQYEEIMTEVATTGLEDLVVRFFPILRVGWWYRRTWAKRWQGGEGGRGGS